VGLKASVARQGIAQQYPDRDHDDLMSGPHEDVEKENVRLRKEGRLLPVDPMFWWTKRCGENAGDRGPDRRTVISITRSSLSFNEALSVLGCQSSMLAGLVNNGILKPVPNSGDDTVVFDRTEVFLLIKFDTPPTAASPAKTRRGAFSRSASHGGAMRLTRSDPHAKILTGRNRRMACM
jgi:hypothetical protein